MREGLRPSSEKYRVDWEGRRGFVWASLLSGAPIILCACPRADDIYEVTASELTKQVYAQWRVPLPIFRGLGPTLLPRPVKLVHLLSAPIPPPAVDPDAIREEDVAAHHAMLTERMNRLMIEALQYG
jgi:hypothetical protein